MILFGKNKGVTSQISKGDFHCPTCDSSQNYNLKRVRRFVTLYQVPVIPLEQLGDYVECLSCRDTYKPKVLESTVDLSPKQFQAEYHAAIKEVMIRMLLSDGRNKSSEIEMLKNIYLKVTRKNIDSEELAQDIARVKNSTESMSKSLIRLQGNLNDEGKELVIQAAFYVAMADGDFQEEEQEFLAGIAMDLGMTPAHFQGVIGTA